MKEIIISKEDSGQRSDKYLLRIFPSMSKSFLYKMLRKKNIVLNGKKMQGNEILKYNDNLKIFFSDDTLNTFMSSNKTINTNEFLDAYHKIADVEVLYEDNNFIILNKPVGVLSQKADNKEPSINEWLIGYLLEKNSITKESLIKVKPSVCNRLDRNTSGIILAAITSYGINTFNNIIKNRSLTKLYLAKVYGKLEGSQHLTGFHHKDETNNKSVIINEIQYNNLSDVSKTEYIKVETSYSAIESIYNDKINNHVTLVELDLITGKSHQIRAHMAGIGHSLIGDSKYGNESNNKKLGYKHQLLHAYKVIFPENEDLLELSGKVIQSNPGWL